MHQSHLGIVMVMIEGDTFTSMLAKMVNTQD